ncbi:MAG: hypothetical protein ACTSR2_02335 [Candidatus Hodarchaeales archaeon]
MHEQENLTVFFDNSELMDIWGAEVPDILMVGGFAIPRNREQILINEVKRLKESYFGDPFVPVKWNIRDLQESLENRRGKELYRKVMNKSKEIRAGVLDAMKSENLTLFISIIHAYSNRKQILGKTKQDLVGFAFGNLLMRTGSYVKDQKTTTRTEVTLDWPESNDRTPFVKEYCSGWESGCSGSVEYFCGPLCNLGFEQGPIFALMELNVGIQMADLIVGITREFIEFSMGKRSKNDFGVGQFFNILEKFWKSNKGKILGYGISLSPPDDELSNRITEIIE